MAMTGFLPGGFSGSTWLREPAHVRPVPAMKTDIAETIFLFSYDA